jgi:hypothetical protein
MASWSVHFACVVVCAEAIVLEVLMRAGFPSPQEGTTWAWGGAGRLLAPCLSSSERPGQRIVQPGACRATLQLSTPGVFTHDVLGSVGDRDLRLCVGVRIEDGVCNKEICSKDRACAGDA